MAEQRSTADEAVHEDLLSTELLDAPTSASAASDIAAVAYSLDTDIERFFDELTIAESTYTPSSTLEEVLEERRERAERRERIRQRTDELLQAALANEHHASDVRLLSEAVHSLGDKQPPPQPAHTPAHAADGGQRGAEGACASAGAETHELQLDVTYPAFGSVDGSRLGGADGKAAELKREADLLRAYLQHGAYADAYKAFIDKAKADDGVAIARGL